MNQHRFWTEIYNGAKLFYISGMVRVHSTTLRRSLWLTTVSNAQVHGRYNKRDTHNLSRFISISKARGITSCSWSFPKLTPVCRPHSSGRSLGG